MAIIPIFSAYEFIGPFSLSHLFLLTAFALTIAVYKKVSIIKSLFFLYLSHFIFSIFIYFLRINEPFSEKIIESTMYTFVNIVLIMQIIKFADRKIFMKITLKVGMICASFLLLQYILMMLNINPPDGRIPWLSLRESQGWADININNIYLRRLHSVFPEPSYFAIYILPLFAYCLINSRFILASFFFISLFLSTSSLGIIGSLIILLFYLFSHKKVRDKLLLLFMVIIGGIIFFIFSKNGMDIINYNMNKIGNLNENSDVRLSGYLDYYFILPDINKLMGIGYNQLPYYFAEYGLKNYSNAFVLSLLQFGMLGLLTLLIFIISKFLNLNSQNKLYILIFVIICSVDAFLYNMYFFYILSFVLIKDRYKLNLGKEGNSKINNIR